MAERAFGRRTWLGGVAAFTMTACEPTRSPDRGAGEPSRFGHALRFVKAATLPRALGLPIQIVPAGRNRALVVAAGIVAIVQGDRVTLASPDSQGDALAMTIPGGFLFAGTVYDWNGRARRRLRGAGMYHSGGLRELIADVRGSRWTAVAQMEAARAPSSLFLQRRTLQGKRLWAYEIAGWGDAALAPDDRIALATTEGRVVLLADPIANEEPVVVFDVNVDPPAYAIGVDRDGVVLLCSAAGYGARNRTLTFPDGTETRTWTTEIVRLAFDGREQSRVKLPFAGFRILTGTPRTVVVGRGLAALDGGRIAWSRPDPLDMFAATDGERLVISRGTNIELVDDEGRVITREAIADTPPVCDPAIGDDGRVWVATESALWRGTSRG